MAGLHLLRSQRIEELAKALGTLVQASLPQDPFAPVAVVVGSRGMERWLRHELAQSLHVCANFVFPFPTAHIEAIVERVAATERAQGLPDAWEPDALAWAIAEVLPGMLERPGFEAVRSYLQGTEGGAALDARQYGLCRKLADVFDRYVAYRPDYAIAWSEGVALPLPEGLESLAWQPRLWRELAGHLEGRKHRAQRLRDAEARSAEAAAGLQGPLFVFGVSSLPPSWMPLLRALAQHMDVHLLMLCASRKYWLDLQSAILAGQVSGVDRDATAAELRKAGAEAGHPLLASMGRVARDFELVLEHQPAETLADGLAIFPKVEPKHALHRLQADLLEGTIPPAEARHAWSEADDSLQFHTCSGPTRQVEVLRDVLLGMLQDEPELEPRDILVMTPDIASYAPLITAVFSEGWEHRKSAGVEGWGPTGAPRIPIEVADLSIRRLNPVADALLRVLEMVDGRLQASAVLDLLTLEPVRERFALAADDIPVVQEWVERSGIRWACDAEHRSRAGQPADPQNTWRFGLRRLLLGVVMADEDGRMLEGADAPGRPTCVRPFDDMEGGVTSLVGKTVEFCNTLFALVDELREPRTAERWSQALASVVDRMTQTPAKAAWLSRRVRQTLEEFGKQAHAAGSKRKLALDAVRAALQGRFEVASAITPEQCGAVTFCAMKPMRGVPYEVVCMLGMDEDAFPRKIAGAAFDLVSARPRIGDTDPRDEDRYLLLEAILSARRKLVVLYTGHDPHTNKQTPPCVPIGELRDVIDQSFSCGEGRVSGMMTKRHPLQGFHPSAFEAVCRGPAGPRPWSFDRRLKAAAEARRRKLPEPPVFLTKLADSAPEGGEVSLDELTRFFKRPSEYLLRTRLKIALDDESGAVADREPVELDGLQRWAVRHSVLQECLEGRDMGQVLRALRAKGDLPLGHAGLVYVKHQEKLARQMVQQLGLAPAAGAGRTAADAPVAIDLRLEGIRLTGSVSNVYAGTLREAQFGAEEGRKLISAWLGLLATRATMPEPRRALIVLGEHQAGEPSTSRIGLRAPDDARAILEDLVRLYLQGIAEPVPLLPSASWEFARALASVTTDPAFFDAGLPSDDASLLAIDRARRGALKSWRSGFQRGDDADPYVARLFEQQNPIEEPATGTVSLPFARLALRVWGPLLAAQCRGDEVEAWLQEGSSCAP